MATGLKTGGAAAAKGEEDYFPVSPLMIFPDTKGKFEVYLKQGGRCVLYTRGQDGFTEEQRRNLFEHGVDEIWVLCEQRRQYEEYVEDNLGSILLNQRMPIEARSMVFYDASARIVQDAFVSKMPGGMPQKQYQRMMGLVEHSVGFFSLKDSLRSVASLISHDYKTYTHSVQVMMYTVAILETLEDMDEDRLREAALGALLHDIGKVRVPRRILEKPGGLNAAEWSHIKRHPALGQAVCLNLSLSPMAMACILFHHEKMDGSGYPACLTGDDLPPEVKALTLADVFDALTTDRSYAEARKPAQALRIMKEEMAGCFDSELFNRLVLVLNRAGIIREPQQLAIG